jgi:hypothetical protein
MAIEQDINFASDYFTGEDKVLSFTIYAADGTTVQSISGWTLGWIVKRRASDGSPLIQKTTSDDIAITNALGGICTVTVSSSDISVLTGGIHYHHELKRTNAGHETVLSYGDFILQPSLDS